MSEAVILDQIPTTTRSGGTGTRGSKYDEYFQSAIDNVGKVIEISTTNGQKVESLNSTLAEIAKSKNTNILAGNFKVARRKEKVYIKYTPTVPQ